MTLARILAVSAAVAVLATTASPAAPAPGVQVGIKDDAWLLYGPGTLRSRVAELDRLGVDIVRFSLRWDQIARERPSAARDPDAGAYHWGRADAVVRELERRGIDAVLTLVGTPSWANGGGGPNRAPLDDSAFADFAYAAATRYPSVRRWTIWNEPNQVRWLFPASPATYVRKLLDPAYGAIHSANPAALVAGGVTAPRANAGGVSPLAWIRAMGRLNARLDAYAHHPYPLRPQAETPWKGGCRYCETISMASLERLISAVRRNLGPTRIWLTEYGYQTNPPDRWLGVSPALQARYAAEATYRVWKAPLVDMLINFLYQDDVPDRGISGGWQSGLKTSEGVAKPSQRAFMLPLVQARRRGDTVTVWGQVRPRSGPQPYRLQVWRTDRWDWVGDLRSTSSEGVFARTLQLQRGATVRFWSPRDSSFSLSVRVG